MASLDIIQAAAAVQAMPQWNQQQGSVFSGPWPTAHLPEQTHTVCGGCSIAAGDTEVRIFRAKGPEDRDLLPHAVPLPNERQQPASGSSSGFSSETGAPFLIIPLAYCGALGTSGSLPDCPAENKETLTGLLL